MKQRRLIWWDKDDKMHEVKGELPGGCALRLVGLFDFDQVELEFKEGRGWIVVWDHRDGEAKYWDSIYSAASELEAG